MIAPVRISDHVPAAPDKQLDKVTLYEGDVIENGQDVPLTLSLLDGIQDIDIWTTAVGGSQSKPTRVAVEELLSGSGLLRLMVYTSAGSGTGQYTIDIDLDNSTNTALRVSATSTYAAPTGVLKVVGYRKRYATENNSVTIPVNSGNNIAVNSRYEVQLPPEYYESNGSVKKGVRVSVEIFNNSGTGVADWGDPMWYDDIGSSFGVRVSLVGGFAVVQTGTTQLLTTAVITGNGFGNTTETSSAPCRVIATLNDKTAISVPVADKGYGGLRKDTVDTSALSDFTVPNVIDFNLPLVSTPLKVTQNVSSNRLSLSQIGIWGSSGSINLTFDSGNNGREIIADIYNETKGQVALEKPEYVARNQLGITIPISVDVLEILTSGDEYSLRVRSNDAFTNVKVGKCWWDVTLNAPL